MQDAVELVVLALEIVGVAILVMGAIWAAAWGIRDVLRREPAYSDVRRRFGHSLLLALEVLVAADVVQTVVVSLTLESIAALGLLVLIRTVLSFSLIAEIEGRPPWRRDAG